VARWVALELASEAKNLHVDAAIEDILMRARGLQQVLTAKWALTGPPHPWPTSSAINEIHGRATVWDQQRMHALEAQMLATSDQQIP
jgi:hypothetical protein